MMKWQPIETSPRDGTSIILGYADVSGKVGARAAFWLENLYPWNKKIPKVGAWVCPIDNILVDQRATHWIKMPEVSK